MPLERVSRGFKDLSMSFQMSPLNSDLLAIKNESAISRSIMNLVLTSPGERFFNPRLGSEVSKSLFENFDDMSASMIKSEIENTIRLYEPRVRLIDVNVAANLDDYEFNVTVNYSIIGIPASSQQLSFALQSAR